jgi:hypothetical protein
MLRAFLEADHIVAATLLAGLVPVLEAPSNNRFSGGRLRGDGSDNKQRKQNRPSVSVHLSLPCEATRRPIGYPNAKGTKRRETPADVIGNAN